MRKRLCWVVLLAACASAPQPAEQPPQLLHGVASWYGQEFAGRTTANGEIFDPLLLTAAHRSLPFGTVVDVLNPKTGQSVRVRVNDRGPYIGGRMIDLSYAAAQQIGLIEPGSGEVDVTVIKVGHGEREPPAPYVVTVPDVKPVPVPAADIPAAVPVIVDNVQVVTEHQGVETRRQVSPDGKRIEDVATSGAKSAEALDAASHPVAPPSRLVAAAARFIVQVGAFAQEPNARLLQAQLDHLGEKSYIESSADLYRVRIGPFDTRDQAIKTRTRLEAAGLSAVIVAR